MIKRWLTPAPPLEDGEPEPPITKRLGWFVGLCLAGALVVSVSAYVLRSLLFIG